MLRAGIVGLPNVGKSTLFNALTSSKNAESANNPFCTIEPNVGVVIVPDERLQVLANLCSSKEIIPTAIEFCDIAGLVKGASQGEGLGNKFLHHIREVDAIIEVVRCFDDANTVHVNGKVDPISDIEVINMELALADLASIEKRLERISKNIKAGEKAALIEKEMIDKVQKFLEDGKFFTENDFTDEQKPYLHGLHLLCAKPIIYAANVSENDIATSNDYVKRVEEYAKNQNAQVVIISAQIEAELVELDKEEAKSYLADLGVENSGTERMINAVYDLLGLRTFFTAGEKETRAWTIPAGAKAPQAAGVIHTDMEKGFIRAEVTGYKDFVESGSYTVARDKGLTRIEGKDYVVEDGDLLHIRFAN
ncbi:MAG: redox-regulated ATPase YchF [Candidatus Gastranaerophilales bacterium]|nr:redox-regulated ATPase YchF [Candidatus Gastranaerophilales bacterium]